MPDKRNFDSLHILKAICAFLVIVHHSYLFGQHYTAPIRVTMVPCFFMISGFFLYRNCIRDEFAKIKQWCIKALIWLISLGIFYSITNCIFRDSQFPLKAQLYNIFTGSSICVVLWYLSALWQGLIIIHLTTRLSQKAIIFYPVFYLLFRIANEKWLHIPFHANTIASAFLDLVNATCFLSTGYLISMYRTKIKKSPSIFGAALFLAYTFILLTGKHNAIAIYIISSSLFLLFLTWDIRKPYFLIYLGKYHSSNLYFFHCFFIALLGEIIINYNLKNIYAVIIFAATFMLSVLWNQISRLTCHLKSKYLRHAAS